MKKVILAILLVFFVVSTSHGQYLIGARAAGMGGAGVAASRDLTAAYYNPAAMMKTGQLGFEASLGAAYSDIAELSNLLNSTSNPAKIITDNFAKKIDIYTGLGGLLGFSANKIGITVLPNLQMEVNKEANALAAGVGANLNYQGIITLGRSFQFMGLSSVDLGANIKYLGGNNGSAIVALVGIDSVGVKTVTNSSGFGLDVGALMSFDIPAVTSLSVGIVGRDLFETINDKIQTWDLNASFGAQTFTETQRADTTATRAVNSTYAIGASGSIPAVGLLVAADYEMGKNFSNTHMGMEYPVIGNFVTLRAGIASGTNLSMTTFGAKLSIPIFAINVAYIMDNKVTKNNQIVVDLAGGL
ncbi:MAG: hypothetical protein FD145_189 [Candidatus Saganbacteria bacterium]|uniref:PorV/PorQ family protein n=1 Tax=Candidatus Saganbacteria bacterium TaxID=2575572 RepID=A0A833L257_UNCSA|nr:MAG: hypothetical protein FD145_189 [Candidatus Saganbacteria bacterium]